MAVLKYKAKDGQWKILYPYYIKVTPTDTSNGENTTNSD